MSSADLTTRMAAANGERPAGPPGHAARGTARVSLAAVVVNWRGPDDTVRCMASLLAATPRPAHIIVVDNASGDQSVEQIGRWAIDAGWSVRAQDSATATLASAPDILIIRSPENLGYAGGANLGARLALQDASVSHVALLNNDLDLAPDYLATVVAAMREQQAGLASGVIYHRAPRDRVWYAGGGITAWRALPWHLSETPVTDAPHPTQFVTGCAMVVSRALVARIGLLPERYSPGYLEDAEYSWRAAAAGFGVLLVPKAHAWHAVGASFGAHEANPDLFGRVITHRVWFVRRNVRGVQRWAALAYLALSKPVRALVEAVSGRPVLGRAILRGWFVGMSHDCSDPAGTPI